MYLLHCVQLKRFTSILFDVAKMCMVDGSYGIIQVCNCHWAMVAVSNLHRCQDFGPTGV